MSENAKLQVIVAENENPKRKVAKLNDDVNTCKQVWLEANDCLGKIKLKEALKKEKMDTLNKIG